MASLVDAKGKTRSTTGRMIPSSMRDVISVNCRRSPARMFTAALVSGLEQIIRFNRTHFGASLREDMYPTMAERRTFAREVEAWLGRAAPAQ